MHEISMPFSRLTLSEVSEYVDKLQEAVQKLERSIAGIEQEESRQTMAERYCAEVLPLMGEIRIYADALEGLVPDALWQLPNYEEILFDK